MNIFSSFLSFCAQAQRHLLAGQLTGAELGHRTQEVVVDDRRGVFALAPAHGRRGGRRDQELFDGLRGRQVGLVDVLVAILDLAGEQMGKQKEGRVTKK